MKDMEIRKIDETIIKGKIVEIKSEIDEIVAKDIKQFHLEVMDNDHVWIGIDDLHIDITAKGKILIRAEKR